MRRIWLCSYPRSGNTLLRTVIFHCFGCQTRSIYNEHEQLLGRPRLAALVGARESEPKEGAQPWDFVKTHVMPGDGEACVYLIRDGRDATLSYWRMRRDMTGIHELTIREMIQGHDAGNGRIIFGSWGDHLRAIQPDRRPDTRIVRFEDLAHHPRIVIERLAGLLGMEPLTYILPSIEEMREAGKSGLVNQGTVGGWRDVMTDEDVDLFEQMHGDVLERYGYERVRHDVAAGT